MKALSQFGIRTKLLAVASVFLLVPGLGYEYIRELERFLRQAQDDTLAATAQAVATALHDRPQLFAAAANRNLASLRDVLDTVAANDPGRVAQPSEATGEIQQILRGLERATSQIWVIDGAQKVRARTGSLRPQVSGAIVARPFERPLEWLETALLSPLYRLILRQPREDFVDDSPADVPPAYGRELDTALSGVLATGTRPTRDGIASVAFAVAPVWAGDRVQGVVVTEQTTNSVLRQRNLAFERLFGFLLLAVLLGALLLFVFASQLGKRIRALRDDARAAVDSEGRIVRPLASSAAGDELGDLSREFAALLRRLADYTHYREHLASRLSHELRTPIAMIRSSLDNLQLSANATEARVYVERAHAGLLRLNFIFDAMAEATRLEAAIGNTPRERFDLRAVVAGCIEGYRSVYPGARFTATLPAYGIEMLGNPELIAQMLDKLIANAVEFALPESPIEVLLATTGRQAVLRISNQGPMLPDGMEDRLFDSMVSVRAAGSVSPHLGLGLYIVRLIAEFHQGTVDIANRPDTDGIAVTIRLPVTSS